MSRSPRSSIGRRKPAGATTNGFDAFYGVPGLNAAQGPWGLLAPGMGNMGGGNYSTRSPHSVRRHKKSKQEQEDEDDNDVDEAESNLPLSGKRRHKRKFYVCNEVGDVHKIVKNCLPSGAAKKGANCGLVKMLIYDQEKDRWYRYIGHRIKIKAKDLNDYQKLRGMKYKTKVIRVKSKEPEIAVVAGESKRSHPHPRRRGIAASMLDELHAAPSAPLKPRVRGPRLADFGLDLDTMDPSWLLGPKGGRLTGHKLLESLAQRGVINI